MLKLTLTVLITQVFFLKSLAAEVNIQNPSLEEIITFIESDTNQEEHIKPPNVVNKNQIICTKSFRSNLRKGPGTNFPVNHQILIANYPLNVIKYIDTWYAVEDFEGTTAWISAVNVKKTCGGIAAKYGLTSLYMHPSEESKVLLSIQRGFVISNITCPTPNWCKAKIENTTGWVKKEDIWGK